MEIGIGISLTIGGKVPAPGTPGGPVVLAPPPTAALSAYVYDVTEGWPLYSLLSTTSRAPASMVKMATAILATRRGALTDTFTVTAADIAIGGTNAQLQANDVITLRDLIPGLLLPSGNDAAMCIGRVIGTEMFVAAGSTGTTGIVRFAEAMNALAVELGMTGTTYITPHGVSADISTCVDQVKILTHLLTVSLLEETIGLSTYNLTITGANARVYAVAQTNQCHNDEGAIGGKTGSSGSGTSFDGVNSSALTHAWVAPNGNTLIGVIMRCSNPNVGDRFLDMRALQYHSVVDFPYLDLTAVGTDPQIANVKLLAGADTGFIDESSVGRTLTADGVTRSTVTPLFGTHSFLSAGSPQTLSAPDAADLSPGLQDFCAECWIGGTGIESTSGAFISKYETVTNNREWSLQYDSTQNRLETFVSTNGTLFGTAQFDFDTNLITPAVFFNGAKRHLALRREGTDVSIYVNGVRGEVQHTIGASAVFAGVAKLGIACRSTSAGFESYVAGRYDEVRLTIGDKRYTGAKFNPSLKPFPRA